MVKVSSGSCPYDLEWLHPWAAEKSERKEAAEEISGDGTCAQVLCPGPAPDQHSYGLNRRCLPQAHVLRLALQLASTILEGAGNLGRWGLAGVSGSLGVCSWVNYFLPWSLPVCLSLLPLLPAVSSPYHRLLPPWYPASFRRTATDSTNLTLKPLKPRAKINLSSFKPCLSGVCQMTEKLTNILS
jgi:hypothetical protein